MSAASMQQDSTRAGRALNVAVVASSRRSELLEIVASLGHLVTAPDVADVLICEGETFALEKPALFIGPVPESTSAQAAAHLPEHANAAQIDAALRAIAVGLQVRLRPGDFKAFDAPNERAPILLTPRELQILTAISDGASNKAIARDLSISLHTVKFHVESLFRKLSVRTRAEAVAKGLERRRGQIEV